MSIELIYNFCLAWIKYLMAVRMYRPRLPWFIGQKEIPGGYKRERTRPPQMPIKKRETEAFFWWND